MGKSKQPPSYDLKKQEHRRSQLIQIGITALVIVFGVAVVGFIIVSNKKEPEVPAPPAGELKAIRVVSPDPGKLVTKPPTKPGGKPEPKVVLTLIEDPICPACGIFEEQFGPTVTSLIDTGAVAVDYNIVGLLDIPKIKRDYSSRAAAAAYCVADQSTDVFLKFHKALYDDQPSEADPKTWLDDKALIEKAKGVGASDAVVSCIKNKTYVNMVKQLGPSLNVDHTPTIRINGKDWELGRTTAPADLVKAVTDITGPVQGLPVSVPSQ